VLLAFIYSSHTQPLADESLKLLDEFKFNVYLFLFLPFSSFLSFYPGLALLHMNKNLSTRYNVLLLLCYMCLISSRYDIDGCRSKYLLVIYTTNNNNTQKNSLRARRRCCELFLFNCCCGDTGTRGQHRGLMFRARPPLSIIFLKVVVIAANFLFLFQKKTANQSFFFLLLLHP
jgi:hypothetical protein